MPASAYINAATLSFSINGRIKTCSSEGFPNCSMKRRSISDAVPPATVRSRNARAPRPVCTLREKSFTASMSTKPRPCQPIAFPDLTTNRAARRQYGTALSSSARRISLCVVPAWIPEIARSSSAGLAREEAPSCGCSSSSTRCTRSSRRRGRRVSRTWDTTRSTTCSIQVLSAIRPRPDLAARDEISSPDPAKF